MNSDLFTGNPKNLNVPESERIRGINPPIIAQDVYAKLSETDLQVEAPDGLLANDRDPIDDELTALLDSTTARGELELFPDGSSLFQHPSDFVGELRFGYRAEDGMFISAPVDVTIAATEPIGVSLINASDDVQTQRLLTENELMLQDQGFDFFNLEVVIYPIETESINITLYGNSGDDYNGHALLPGNYSLTVTAYDQNNANGNELAKRTMRFEVFEGSLKTLLEDGFEL